MAPLEPIPNTSKVSWDFKLGVLTAQKRSVALILYVISSCGLKDHVWICSVSQKKQYCSNKVICSVTHSLLGYKVSLSAQMYNYKKSLMHPLELPEFPP